MLDDEDTEEEKAVIGEETGASEIPHPAVATPKDLLTVAFSSCSYISDFHEEELIAILLNFTRSDWSARLFTAFSDYCHAVAPHLPPDAERDVQQSFLSWITPAQSTADRIHPDPYVAHCSQTTKGSGKALFSYMSWCLVSAACSEASCERLFSLARWIVGDRRGRLMVSTITDILRTLLTKDQK